MKRSIANYVVITFTISALLYVLSSTNKTIDLSKYSTEGLDLHYSVCANPNPLRGKDSLKATLSPKFSPYLGKSFEGFKQAIAFKESGGDYSSVNTYGYLGKYQFGVETLKMIGIKNPEAFLKTPTLQEKAFNANTSRNKWILRRDIKAFIGKRINGIVVTESGILAAAHLAGPGSVKKYLRSYGLDNFADGYGTTIYKYMKYFSGYDTSFIKPNRRAKAI